MKVFGLFLAIFISTISFGQRKPEFLLMKGSVLGYHYEPKKLFKQEQVEIQGNLSGVQVKVTSNGKEISKATTSSGGDFALYIPLKKNVKLTYSKSGYGTSAININLNASIPDEMFNTGLLLENIELILNDNQTGKSIDKGIAFADLTYNGSARVFYVSPMEFDKKDRLFKEIENSTPVNLLSRSVKKNDGNNKKAIVNNEVVENNENVSNNNNTVHESNNNFEESNIEEESSIEKKIRLLKSTKFGDVGQWKDLTVEDLSERADEISHAWNQLEQDKLVAVTEEDFIIIEAREELLLSAERELDAAKAYIEEQEGKLNAQRNFMYVLIFLILLLGGFVFYLIKSIREKNRLNFELDKRNKKITASINYAERIQKSVLLRDEEIKAILPNSFVYYDPLDVVSGDFYWFSEVNGKAIVAAVDCTGHGVPGAFMSLIGNTLLNQIVNEKKIIDPAKILKNLHEGIVKSLNQEEDEAISQDGMDMSICMIDKASGELTYSGAVNPIYVVEKGEVKEVSGDIRGVGGVLSKRRKREVKYTEQKFKLEKGTNIYMFSDGYMDQFGGANNEKFNIPRFKEMLSEIQNQPMDKQKEQIEKTIKDWKGSSDQIDDILVIGIQV